jgi:hypothetical protein
MSSSVKGLLEELNLDELCVRLGNTQVTALLKLKHGLSFIINLIVISGFLTIWYLSTFGR